MGLQFWKRQKWLSEGRAEKNDGLYKQRNSCSHVPDQMVLFGCEKGHIDVQIRSLRRTEKLLDIYEVKGRQPKYKHRANTDQAVD
jgi:hypothetical protein